MKIITLKFCFLILFSCVSQVDKKENGDTFVLFDIIFANGFNSDEIVLTVNENKIIQVVLSSDESDGVTSLAYKIIKKEEKIILSRDNEAKYTFEENNQKNIELAVMYKGKNYSYQLDEKKGRYILIELNNDIIEYIQQKEQPLFD